MPQMQNEAAVLPFPLPEKNEESIDQGHRVMALGVCYPPLSFLKGSHIQEKTTLIRLIHSIPLVFSLNG